MPISRWGLLRLAAVSSEPDYVRAHAMKQDQPGTWLISDASIAVCTGLESCGAPAVAPLRQYRFSFFGPGTRFFRVVPSLVKQLGKLIAQPMRYTAGRTLQRRPLLRKHSRFPTAAKSV